MGRGGGRLRRGDQRAHAPGRRRQRQGRVARASASTPTGSSTAKTSRQWRARSTPTTRGWSRSARSGCPGTASARRPIPTRSAGMGRERLDRLIDLAVRYDLPVILHAPARRRGGRPGRAQAPERRARGVPLAQGERRGHPGDRGRGLPGLGHPRCRLPRARPRDGGSGADRVAAGGERRALAVSGRVRERHLGPVARRAGGGRGGQDQAAARRTRRRTELTVNTCRLFDLVWA